MPDNSTDTTAAPFRLTFATMFDPPQELHSNYEAAVAKLRGELGGNVPMYINGEDVFAAESYVRCSPINTDWQVGRFQKGTKEHALAAVAAARRAFPAWAALPWQERVARLRHAMDIADERVYKLAAVLSFEVGKNRSEALGDAAEIAGFTRYYCNQMEERDGYTVHMGRDPLKGYVATNVSVQRPHGVWVVIGPFNFPAALTAGPAGAALIAGNTVVIKSPTDAPWSGRVFTECLRDAGIPDGVVNYVTGPGSTLGEALIQSPDVDGITFTGSYKVGMHILRTFAAGRYPRPAILEMGGKNPSIVSRNADLGRAASGIARSAFGLCGQKCSANSRVYIERPVYRQLVDMLLEQMQTLVIADPTDRKTSLGPVINETSYEKYQQFVAELGEAGRILAGGRVLTDGALAKGYYCEPTLAVDVPLRHHLWTDEMFLPITMLHAVDSLDEAMALAVDTDYGLTAGFYGSEAEAEWFFDHTQAGVNLVNRPQGSTTGAWPGYQPFGGWKGSGSTGKNAGGVYYLPQYMREQIRTVIR